MRKSNTNINGKAFDHDTIMAVWKKAKLIKKGGLLSGEVRADKYENEIHFDQYGNTQSKFGWEIDHIIPVSAGGKDNLANLQPLYWEANRKKSDGQA